MGKNTRWREILVFHLLETISERRGALLKDLGSVTHQVTSLAK
jgi:hypothetical protein